MLIAPTAIRLGWYRDLTSKTREFTEVVSFQEVLERVWSPEVCAKKHEVMLFQATDVWQRGVQTRHVKITDTETREVQEPYGERRIKANHRLTHALVFDLDKQKASAEEKALRWLVDHNFRVLRWPSFSHFKAKKSKKISARWLIPLPRPLSGEPEPPADGEADVPPTFMSEHDAVTRYLQHVLSTVAGVPELLDRTKLHGGSIFYAPSVHPDFLDQWQSDVILDGTMSFDIEELVRIANEERPSRPQPKPPSPEAIALWSEDERVQKAREHLAALDTTHVYELAKVPGDYAVPREAWDVLIAEAAADKGFDDAKQDPENIRTKAAHAETYRKNPIGFRLADGDKPIVDLTTDLREDADKIIPHLRRFPNLYQRNGELVTVGRDVDGELRIVRANGSLKGIVSHVVTTRRPGKKGVPSLCKPPDDLVTEIESRTFWENTPGLRAISESPVLLYDGTVLTESGYYPEMRMLLDLLDPVDVPEAPSLDDARAAAGRLLDLVADFPFRDGVAVTAWLASLLTQVLRPGIDGPVPATIIEANSEGTGKSLLVRVVCTIAEGNEPSAMEWDADGMGEQLFSASNSGRRKIWFDNCRTRELSSGALEAALTAQRIERRRFHTQTLAEVPFDACVYITINNGMLGGDLHRRALLVRLATSIDRPGDRPSSSFRIPDLLAHVREHRLDYLRDALTIGRAFRLAGSPKQTIRSWGSYEAWTKLVPSALVWLGLPDVGVVRDELAEMTADKDSLAQLVEALDRCLKATGKTGMTAAEICDGSAQDSDREASERLGDAKARAELRDALREILGQRENTPLAARRVAEALRDHGQACGGRRIVSVGLSDGRRRWGIQR